MRIAVLSDMLRPTGANIMAVTDAALLQARGHDVLVVSGSHPRSSVASLLHGVEFDAFLRDDHVLDYATGVQRIELTHAAERWLYGELEAWRPDIVLCHNTGRIFDQVAIARLSQRHPVVVVLHDEWFLTDQHYATDPAMPSQVYTEPFRSKSVRDHDFSHLWNVPVAAGRLLAVAPSAWLQDRWSQVFPTLPCVLVHNPVDADVFGVVEQDEARRTLGLQGVTEVVGFVGDLGGRRKNLKGLMTAVASMPRDERPTVLIAGGSVSWVGKSVAARIAGGGLLEERLRANGGGVLPSFPARESAVVLAGVGRRDFKNVYAAMDLLVHPSRVENLPTVPIEARYCGVPMLVSDVGGSREVVESVDDLFSVSLPPAKLAKRIRTALDAHRGRQLEDRRRAHSVAREAFSPDTRYGALMPVIEALVA